MDHNHLTSIPIELAQLTNLTKLSLDNNRLTSVPAELGRLTNLEQLKLNDNQLNTLPSELGQLSNLKQLGLCDNLLTSVPAELGWLTNLTRLDLGQNKMASVPPELGQLTNLMELYLHNNKLTSVPDGLGQLTYLARLNLGGNQLTSVTSKLGQLSNLKQLGLYDNLLTSVPAELGQLTKLTELDLGDNKLASVPSELGQLTNLTELVLSDNQLTAVPAELGQLTNLTRLFLHRNQLTHIPAELGLLTRLEIFALDGNQKLISPPPAMFKQGTKAILAYLRGLAKGKKKRYEAKLLILGDADEGKTCVSRALRGEPFEHQETTQGVDIEQWEFGHPDHQKARSKRITLNVWDFEGQEINHQSHQFFLTQRALYLLVFKGREVFNRARVEYWLDTIRSRAPESEVILVATECEKRTPRVPVEELRARYPDLLKYKRCFFAVGCLTNKGVKALQNHLQKRAVKLEVMGAGWPAKYAKAEKAIEKRAETKAHITRRTLHGIFKKSGIPKGDYGSAASLMGYLGIITHFPASADLKDFVVLKPQWLTKAISFALENPQLEKDKGEITHQRLHSLWEQEYEGLSEILHKSMKEFELCYDLEYRNRHLSLVPLRFGFEEPKRIPWSKTPNTRERMIEYRFSVRPPAGIMSRFIVKTHYMIVKNRQMPKGVYWYNGVFLGTGEGDNRSEALCEFDEDKRLMNIRVRAAFPQNMGEQLNGVAQSVFSFFEGLRPERYYGCVKSEKNRESQCEGKHWEKVIFSALAKGRVIDCVYGDHDADPKLLVYGFSSFGKFVITADEIKQAVKDGVRQIAGDVMTLLVEVDKISGKVDEVRDQGKNLPAEIGQQIELKLRDYLGLFDEMLDNRDFNSAPAVVSIVPADGSRFDPRRLFNKQCKVIPYCEHKGGVHPVGFSVSFKKPKVWWQKTALKLAIGLQVLSAGVRIACAGLPLAVDPKLFEAMKNEVGFMKELAGHLKLEGGAESDISDEPGELVERLGAKGDLRDLRQGGGEDDKRIVRIQLAELFREIAPKNYRARQWGSLSRVRMPDNTYRWLCDKHAAEYKK